MTNDDLLEKFKEYLVAVRGLRPQTIDTYITNLRIFTRFLDGRLLDATLDDVERYLAAQHRRGLRAATIHLRLHALRALNEFVGVRKLAKPLPLDAITLSKGEQRLPIVLTHDEIAALMEAASGPRPVDMRDRAFLEFTYASAARASEAATLRVANLNLPENVAKLTGKGGTDRLVPFNESAHDALVVYLRDARPGMLRTCAVEGDSPFVFVTTYGSNLNRTGVWRIVQRRAAKAGLAKRVHPHCLRHSAATHLLEAGADLFYVKEILGHASVLTTQRYVHLGDTHIRKAHATCFPRA